MTNHRYKESRPVSFRFQIVERLPGVYKSPMQLVAARMKSLIPRIRETRG